MLFLFFSFILSEKNYVCLIDAGSSTDLYVYSISASATNEPPELLNKTKLESQRSLATAYYDSSVVPAIFTEAMRQAKDDIHRDNLTFTDFAGVSFYVCGTSAMRDLDPIDQEDIRKQVIEFINGTFLISNETVMALTTAQEASYTFISVNIALKKVKDFIPVVGISGGNSFLVAATSGDDTIKHEIHYKDQNINVFVADYSKFSTNGVKGNHTKQLARYSGNANVLSPCYEKGFVSQNENAIIQVSGNGSFTGCLESLTSHTMAFEKNKNKPDYFFDGLFKPKIDDNTVVYAISSYYTTWSTLFQIFSDLIPEMKEELANISITNFEKAGTAFCSLSNETINAKIDEKCTPAELGCDPKDFKEYAESDCLEFALQTKLLRDGYALGDTKVRRVNKIDGISVGWQMGLVLSQVTHTEVVPTSFPIYVSVIIGVIVFAIVVAVIVIVIKKCISKHREEDKDRGTNYVPASAFDIGEEE